MGAKFYGCHERECVAGVRTVPSAISFILCFSARRRAAAITTCCVIDCERGASSQSPPRRSAAAPVSRRSPPPTAGSAVVNCSNSLLGSTPTGLGSRRDRRRNHLHVSSVCDTRVFCLPLPLPLLPLPPLSAAASALLFVVCLLFLPTIFALKILQNFTTLFIKSF